MDNFGTKNINLWGIILEYVQPFTKQSSLCRLFPLGRMREAERDTTYMSETPVTLLIIEDDLSYGHSLKEFLAHEGYQPVVCVTAQAALDHLTRQLVDVALVDLKLPDMADVEIIRTLGQRYPHLPIVILTAYPTLESAVEAIKRGVSDYLIKPCPLTKLLQSLQQALDHQDPLHGQYQDILNQIQTNIGHIDTLKSLLTKTPATSQPIQFYPDRFLSYGPLRLDFFRRIVTVDQLSLETTSTEFELLAYLTHHAPRVIAPQELVSNLWGIEVSANEAGPIIRRHIYIIRRKIRDLGRDDPIQTERGLGYRIKAPGESASS